MSEKVDLQVDGGAAAPGPQMASAFGPLGIDMGAVIQEINNKTGAFSGMKVPVTVEINDDKSFDVSVGVPGAGELIKKELSLEKGSGRQALEKVGNLSIEQIIKIANMKKEGMLVNDLKSAVNTVIGSCQAMGVLVEGKEPKESNKDVLAGKYDKEILEVITEASAEKLELMKQQFNDIKAVLEKELAKVQPKEEEKKEGEEAAAENGEKKEEPKKEEKK
jgi:large subunit ribosomal protein L11